MAVGDRFRLEGKLLLDGRQAHGGRWECGSVYDRWVEVPAGESRLLQFSDQALGANGLKVLACSTDIPGVEVWPIGIVTGETCEVDPNTRRFGWLFDPAAPVFDHDHGAVSDVASDHSPTGERLFYDTLPSWIIYGGDTLKTLGPLSPNFHYASFYEHATYRPFTPARSSDGYVHDGGRIISANAGAASAVSVVRYLFGMAAGQYQNLGTATDGLIFAVPNFRSSASDFGAINVRFYNYPYGKGWTEPEDFAEVPDWATAYWADDDLVLGTIEDDGLGNLYGIETAQAGGYAEVVGAAPATSGHRCHMISKVGATLVAGTLPTGDDVSGYDVARSNGGFVWNRVTSMDLRLNQISVPGGGGALAYFYNVYFGPRGGHRLRLGRLGFAMTDAGFFQESHRPALGVQNPTSRRAIVRAILGTT